MSESTTKKPAWVEALDKAQLMLEAAAACELAELADAKTRIANAYIAVAIQLKDVD